MKEEVIKITCKSYLFEMDFSTEYCASIKATDVCDGRVYENKNVEFRKIQKVSVISALQQKNKEITSKISEHLIEDQMNRSQDDNKVKQKRCLEVEFIVNSDFILPFSQKVILYEVQSERRSEKMLPKEINEKTAKQIRKSIDVIDKSISSLKKEQDEIQIYEFGVMQMAQKREEQTYTIYVLLAYGVGLLILWATYFVFLEILALAAIGGLLAYFYLSTQKFLIKQIQLQEGCYKVDITGQMNFPSNYSNQRIGINLYATLNALNRQKLNIHLYFNYAYTYPFNATFFIESNKPQLLTLELQKNKIANVNLNNVIITCQKVPFITKIQ